MRVAVITPYYVEPEDVLTRCIDSVNAQTHPCTHIMIADGYAEERLPGLAGQHIVLPVAHGDYGDTPRLIGTLTAYQQGFDAICWLDADNWYEPDHVERLVKIAEQDVVSVVTTTRKLRRTNGSLLGVCTESDGVNFCDTNCYLITRDAIPVIAPTWAFKPRAMGVIGDRFVWQKTIDNYTERGHCSEPTVNYTTNIAVHYLAAGEEPPSNARVIMQKPGQPFPTSVPYAEAKNS